MHRCSGGTRRSGRGHLAGGSDGAGACRNNRMGMAAKLGSKLGYGSEIRIWDREGAGGVGCAGRGGHAGSSHGAGLCANVLHVIRVLLSVVKCTTLEQV